MIKVLFVCHGNICRSPMSQLIFQDLIEKKGLEDRFRVDSAATSSEEIGNPIYPPARRKLQEHGIASQGHRARKMTAADYDRYDYLIAMEQYNIRNMLRIIGADPEHKVSLLLDHTDHPGDIDDPWYTGDFEKAYQDIRKGCEGLLQELL